jgi:hypothetical protein
MASSCGAGGAHLYFSTLNSRRWKNNQFNARQTALCVLCACSSCCGGGHKGAVERERERERAQLTACVIDIFASMCAQFPNTSHTDEAPSERASERRFSFYCKEDFCRAAALIIKRAHTHNNNNNTKNICAMGVRPSRIKTCSYLPTTGLLCSLEYTSLPCQAWRRNWHRTPPDGASNAQFTKADDFCCTLQSDITALAFTRGTRQCGNFSLRFHEHRLSNLKSLHKIYVAACNYF